MASKARRQKPAALVILACSIFAVTGVARIAASSCGRTAATDSWAALFRSFQPVAAQNRAAELKLALLIDGVNIGPARWKPLLDAVRTRGDIVDARIYAPEASVRGWAAKLLPYGIKPVVLPPQSGAESPLHMAMAADAEEICLRPCGDRVSGVVIACGGYDLAFLARRIRAWGFSAFVSVRASPDTFCLYRQLLEEASGNRLVVYEHQERTTNKSVSLNLTDLTHGIQILEGALTDYPQPEEVEQLKSVLQKHNYASEPTTKLLLPACAKFFHVNKLGMLTVWPLHGTLRDAYNAIVLPGSKQWRANPGDIIFVQPDAGAGRTAAGSSGFNRCVRAGGPFILKADCGLVDTVLRRLGYTEDQASVQCIENFWKRNRKMLLTYGFAIGDAFDTQKQKLEEIFRAESIPQLWRTIARNFTVR